MAKKDYKRQLEVLYYSRLGEVARLLAEDMIAEKDPLTRCELIKGYIEVGHFLKDTGTISPSL